MIAFLPPPLLKMLFFTFPLVPNLPPLLKQNLNYRVFAKQLILDDKYISDDFLENKNDQNSDENSDEYGNENGYEEIHKEENYTQCKQYNLLDFVSSEAKKNNNDLDDDKSKTKLA
jgi:hypothetical protein